MQGVQAKGNARADFGESRGGFVEVEGDILAEKTDSEGEADTAAGDGDGEGFLG